MTSAGQGGASTSSAPPLPPLGRRKGAYPFPLSLPPTDSGRCRLRNTIIVGRKGKLRCHAGGAACTNEMWLWGETDDDVKLLLSKFDQSMVKKKIRGGRAVLAVGTSTSSRL